MTIRELEILLYLRKNDKLSFDVVQEKIVSSINADSFDNKESFDSIFNDMELYENKHLKGNMNFFGKTVNEIEREIKNISPRN